LPATPRVNLRVADAFTDPKNLAYRRFDCVHFDIWCVTGAYLPADCQRQSAELARLRDTWRPLMRKPGSMTAWMGGVLLKL
jgi:hypothetical protein